MAGQRGREQDALKRSLSPAPTPSARATAHAKVILFGEHSVVYGGPAIALPVPALELTAVTTSTVGPLSIDSSYYRGPIADAPAPIAAPATAMTTTLELVGAEPRDLTVRVEGDIPAERGLGSSAAAAAAISAAVAKHFGVDLTADEHFELVQAAERIAHGAPSGLDARAVTSRTPIRFQSGRASMLPMRLGAAIVIADTGITGNTREAVADVRRLRERHPELVERILTEIDTHATAAGTELGVDARAALGERMYRVHDLLRDLTVSSPELDRLVEAARQAGAIGAKMTGGGRGGCALAMVEDPAQAPRIVDALRAAGAIHTWTLQPEELVA